MIPVHRLAGETVAAAREDLFHQMRGGADGVLDTLSLISGCR